MKLFPYQEEGVEFLVNRPMPSRSALLALEMGLGKSCVAIKACDQLSATKILVVCPAFLRENWTREFEIWSEQSHVMQIISSSTDIVQHRSTVTLVSYDLIGKGFMPGCPGPVLRQLLSQKFDVGIFDESHYLKDRGSLRTRAVFLAGHLASKCDFKFFLTGTPVLNRPIELYSIMKACVPKALDQYNTAEKFAVRYCGGHFDGYTFWDRGAGNIEELQERLDYSGLMLRREKKDVLKDLPEKFFQVITLDKDAKLNKLTLEQMKFEKLDGLKFKSVDIDKEKIAKLRQELALAKLPAAADFIRNLLEQKPKLVVFCHHHAVIDALKETLFDLKHVVVDGRVPMPVRQACVDAFQKDPEVRVFIGQVQAAGVGITLTAADHVIFVEPSWVPGEINQAVDRCHRIGQKNTVTAQFLVVADSLEETMMRQVVSKLKTIGKLIKTKGE